MRKITEQAVKAFYANKNFRNDNTEIEVGIMWTEFYLFGNRIALLNWNELKIDSCGYKTNTTKERLNWILAEYTWISIRQIKGVWYFVSWGDKIEFKNHTKINLDTWLIIKR